MEKVKILKQNGYNFLWIDNRLVMWDIPLERKLQDKIAKQAFGNILVAGYGLGIIQKFLMKNQEVKSILTLEKSKEVLDEVRKLDGQLYGDVKIEDFYSCDLKEKFDCIIGDTWDDIISESLADYERFKEKSKKLIKPNGKILAWGQDFFEYLLNSQI